MTADKRKQQVQEISQVFKALARVVVCPFLGTMLFLFIRFLLGRPEGLLFFWPPIGFFLFMPMQMLACVVLSVVFRVIESRHPEKWYLGWFFYPVAWGAGFVVSLMQVWWFKAYMPG